MRRRKGATMKGACSAALALVSVASIGTVVACASDDTSSPTEGSADGGNVVVTAEAGSEPAEAGSDGAPADAGCEACAPVDCSTTDFCVTSAPISSVVSLNAIWGSSP